MDRSHLTWIANAVVIGDDHFDLARQQFEAVKSPPSPTAILIRHALESFGLNQYGLVLSSRICLDFMNLALLVHVLKVALNAKLGSPCFAIS